MPNEVLKEELDENKEVDKKDEASSNKKPKTKAKDKILEDKVDDNSEKYKNEIKKLKEENKELKDKNKTLDIKTKDVDEATSTLEELKKELAEKTEAIEKLTKEKSEQEIVIKKYKVMEQKVEINKALTEAIKENAEELNINLEMKHFLRDSLIKKLILHEKHGVCYGDDDGKPLDNGKNEPITVKDKLLEMSKTPKYAAAFKGTLVAQGPNSANILGAEGEKKVNVNEEELLAAGMSEYEIEKTKMIKQEYKT